MIGAWAFLHLLGMVLWLGGAFAGMAAGLGARGASRAQQGSTARVQGLLQVRLVGPGAFLTVVSGLVLTIRLYGAMRDGAPGLALVIMQVAGLIAAILALFIGVPTASRLARLDPEGPHAAAFDALRARQTVVSSIAGTLGLIALLAAALLKYPG